MVILVIGGSASGKSEYAEERAMELAGQKDSRLIYLATMKNDGHEAANRIKRHRELRAGKGFWTLECAQNLAGYVGDDYAAKQLEASTVLLECMSNLVANELFNDDGSLNSAKSVKQDIIDGIKKLSDISRHLIIVSIDVFGDGYTYDDSTMEYIRCLGEINRELSQMADHIIEVVCGIAIEH